MKKLLCYILALIMSVSCIGGMASSSTGSQPKLIEALNIMSGGSDDDLVTRSEFLNLALTAIKSNYSGYSGEPIFSDITVGHNYYGVIMYAASLGIISGADNGRFYPDDYATLEEALIITINAMQYKPVAEEIGYTGVAQRLGLLNGVSVGGINPITRKDARTLLTNLLQAPIPEIDYSNNNIKINEKGKTFLKHIWGAYSATGVVETTPLRSLSLSGGKEGYVTIGGVEYLSSVVPAEDYFGMKVKLFYTENDDDKELVYIYPTNSNTTEEYFGRDFLSNTTDSITFSSDSGKAVTYKLGSQTVLMWNNRILSSQDFWSKTSKDTERFSLIDNDGDGVIDLLSALEPTIYYGGIVNVRDAEIVDSDHPILKLSEYRSYVLRDSKGETLNIQQLRDEWHYIVYDPEDYSNSILVVASDDFLEGEVAGIDEDGMSITLNIGDTYRVLPQAKVSIGDFTIGNQYKLFFNSSNDIINAEETRRSNIQAAYLMAAKKSGIGIVTVKMLSENNEIFITELSSQVTFRDANGAEGRLSAEKAYDLLTSDDKAVQQLVFIKENNQGKITTIIQPCEDTEKPYHIQEFSKSTASTNSARRWMATQQSFENQIQLKRSTKVFAVPDRNLTGQEDKYFKVNSTSMFKHDTAYRLNEVEGALEGRYRPTPIVATPGEFAADYLVLECPPETEFSSGSNDYGLITNIWSAYDSETDQVVKQISLLSVFTNLEKVYSVTPGQDGNILDRDGFLIERGDLIQLNTSSSVISSKNLLLYYDQSEDIYHYVTSFDIGTGASNEIGYRFYAGFRVSEGRVEGIAGNIAKCTSMRSSRTELITEYIDFSNAKIIEFSLDSNKYTVVNPQYLRAGDEYVATMSNGQFKTIIFYK